MSFEQQLASPHKINSAGSTNASSLKATAGSVFGFIAHNTAAYAVYVKYYDKASAPTVGTDVPLYTVQIPAGLSFVWAPPIPISHYTGIALAITKLAADTDTTPVLAGDLLLTHLWA